MSHSIVFLSLILLASTVIAHGQAFVTVKDHQFILNNKPYYFVGTNYWYGSLLGLEKDKKRGCFGDGQKRALHSGPSQEGL